jgi:hypothetical protein
MLRDSDDLLALGETLNFLLKVQNCSDVSATLRNFKISLEFENGRPQTCRL